MRQLLLFVFAIVSASWACTGSSTERSNEGVEAETWSVSDEPRLRIGEQDGNPNYLLDRIGGVGLLPDGRVVVADGGSASVRVFDRNGQHIVSVGRPGDGPGEFRGLHYISVVAPDTILVYDGRLFRATRFLTDGTLISTLQINPEDGSPEVFAGTYPNGDMAIGWIVPGPRNAEEAEPDLMKLGRFGADGSFITELLTTSGMRRLGPGPVPFTPYPRTLLLGDSLIYGDGMEPTLTVSNEEGRLAREISVAIPTPDLEAAWTALRAEMETRGEEERLDHFPPGARAERVPAFATVLEGNDGHIWLKHYEPKTDSYLVGGLPDPRGGHWSVINAAGNVVAEIELPTGFAPLEVAAQSVAGVHRDDLGVERVLVFDLHRR